MATARCNKCSNWLSDLCELCSDKDPCKCTSYFNPHQEDEDAEKDSWTGRPREWECICLSLPHPHCPQHGDNYHRRNDIPSWMKVDF